MFKRFSILVGVVIVTALADAQPVVQSTPYTRDLLRSTDAAAARAKLGAGASTNYTTELNARQFGVTNSITFSNAVAAAIASNAVLYLPGGVYTITNNVVFTAPVTVRGDLNTVLNISSVPASQYALDARNVAGARFHNLTFRSSNTNWATNATGGAIYLNGIGFSEVRNCRFENQSGNAVYVRGDNDIYLRSNHWTVADCVFSNYWNGIVGEGGDRSEGGIITGNHGQWTQNKAVFLQGPNVVITGNQFWGYTGSAGVPTSWGLQIVVSNSLARGHCVVSGNLFGHHKYDGWFEKINGSGGSGTIMVNGNAFGGGQYFMVTNCTMPVFVGNLIGPYATNFFFNVTNATLVANTIQKPWLTSAFTYSSFGNTSNGVPLATLPVGGTNVFSGGTNTLVTGTTTNELAARSFAPGYPYTQERIGDASTTLPAKWQTPFTDTGLATYFALTSKGTITNATARLISLKLDPSAMEGRIALGTAGNTASGALNFIVDLDAFVPGSYDFEVNTNGYAATRGNGGHVATSFITSVRATPPSFAETGSVTNRVIEWWSNSIPPLQFYSVYYANNTSVPKTTNAPNPLPGP